MKYFYFIFTTTLIALFFIFSNLNSKIITLDLFFVKIEGISVGFSMIFSILLGAIISLILQTPWLLRRNSKAHSVKEYENH